MPLTPPTAAEIKKLDFKNPALWVATWFGCGLMRPAPGTWGTLGALPIGMILMALGGYAALGVGIVIVTLIGLWAARGFETMTGTHDSGMIVIDEVAGMWIALLACVGNPPVYIIAAFLLFRFFDILKPFPVGWLDKSIPGAWGVMADDLMAGLYAAFIILGAHHAFAG